MKTVSLSVRCTREEYMQFCVSYPKKHVWILAVSAVLLLCVVVIFAMFETLRDLGMLFLIFGLVGIFTEPVILPMIRKGNAAKKYDNSDFLKQAMTLVMTEETVTVRSACHEGEIPLCLLTAVRQTADMTALVFGEELTVPVPHRAMTEDDYQTFCSVLKKYKKD